MSIPIPNFIHDKFVDDKGHMTDQWSQVMSQLFTAVQTILNPQGHQLPLQPTTTIAQLTNPANKGAMMYDSTTDQMKINVNGVIKTVTVT